MKDIVISAFFDELQKIAQGPMNMLGGKSMTPTSFMGQAQQMPKPSNSFTPQNSLMSVQNNANAGTMTANRNVASQANAIPQTNPAMSPQQAFPAASSLASQSRSSATLYNANPTINYTM